MVNKLMLTPGQWAEVKSLKTVGNMGAFKRGPVVSVYIQKDEDVNTVKKKLNLT